MEGETKSSGLPTSMTPYMLGAGVLVLIAVFSLMASVPWANKSEIDAIKGYIKNEMDWLKLQQATTQRQVDAIEIDRHKRSSEFAEYRSRMSEFERRLLRLEDSRPRSKTPLPEWE